MIFFVPGTKASELVNLAHVVRVKDAPFAGNAWLVLSNGEEVMVTTKALDAVLRRVSEYCLDVRAFTVVD